MTDMANMNNMTNMTGMRRDTAHAHSIDQRRAALHRRRLALVTALVITTAVTAAALIWLWPLAWVPAALLNIMFALYAVSRAIDWRVHHESRLPPISSVARKQALIGEARQRVGIMALVTIAAGLIAVAAVLASVVFEWRVVGLGALAIFLLLVFFGFPVWVAAIQEEVGAEQAQLTGTPAALQRTPAPTTLGGPAVTPPPESI